MTTTIVSDIIYLRDFILNQIEIYFRLWTKDQDKNGKFHCHKCKRRFKTRKRIELHIKSEHANVKKKFECDICQENFQTYYKMKKHFKLVHHISRSSEKYRTNVQYTLEEWNDIVASKSRECPVCHKTYKSGFKMRRHLQGVHSSYISKELEIVINTRKKYTKIEDTGDFTSEEWKEIVASKSNECPVCHKTYFSPCQMRRHLREVHSSQKKHICDICGKLFTSPERVADHIKNIHLGTKKEEEKYECDVCKKIMRSKHAISDHMSIHTGEKLHHCKICNKAFGFSSDISRHMKHHKLLAGELHNLYECRLCHKSFLESNLLNKHVDLVHKNNYNLCKICGKRYKHLHNHMLTHTKEKKVFCHICGMSLRRGLKRHMMTHTGEKPFACDVCGSTFRARSNLSRHMLKHGLEKSFECKFCKKNFSTQSAYQQHEQKHETDSMLKSRRCHICKIRFESDEALNSHYSEHFALT